MTYPTTGFANQLKQVAQIMAGDLGTRIFYVQLGGFDTHSGQLSTQAGLLKTLSDGVDAFLKDLEAHGWGDDVAIMCFSEFGRRVAENGSAGTDHGSAGPMFVIAPKTGKLCYRSCKVDTDCPQNATCKLTEAKDAKLCHASK